MLDKLITGSAFTRNMTTLISGTVVAQVINFLFSIFLTRIYSPSDFGLVSLFISIVSFLTIFSCGKLDVALVAAGTDEDARKLFALANLIMLITGGVLLLAVPVFYFFPQLMPFDREMSEWLWMIPVSVVFLTGTQAYWMWNVRKKYFKGISYVRVLEALSLGAGALLLQSLSATGLFLATLGSQLLSFLSLFVLVFRRDGLRRFVFTLPELKRSLRQYSEFPKVNIPQGFLDIFQVNAFVIAGASYFANDVVGYYSLSMRVLQLPMRLLILPVSHVFFAEASERYRKGESLLPLVRATVFRGMIYALPVPLVLLLAGPSLFGWVFGKEWTEAGMYAAILSIWIYADLIRAPVAQVASILGKQKRIFVISLFSNLALLMALLAGIGYWNSPRITFMLLSASQSLFAVLIILSVLKMAGQSGINRK